MSDMSLRQTFEAQARFQRHIDSHPESMEDPEELIQYIKDMLLGAESELHEALGEVGWKPWATSRHINQSAFKSEIVDAFQFIINLCLAAKMTADELLALHQLKLEKNYARANGGYDGVSTKCRWCGRALDDQWVSCELSSMGLNLGYCSEKAETGDGFFTAEDLENKK